MKITSIDISLNSSTPPTVQETSIAKYQPPKEKKVGRRYEGKDRTTYGPYLENMFYNNEIEAYLTIPRMDSELKFRFLKEHSRNYLLKKRFARYKETIGNLRNKYNRRKLYSLQNPVYLLSFAYDDNSNMLESMQCHKYLTFAVAYQRCTEFKVADPRFISPDKIALLRDRINSGDISWEDWSVPPDNFIKSLERKIGMPIYDSVKFPRFCTREETMEGD